MPIGQRTATQTVQGSGTKGRPETRYANWSRNEEFYARGRASRCFGDGTRKRIEVWSYQVLEGWKWGIHRPHVLQKSPVRGKDHAAEQCEAGADGTRPRVWAFKKTEEGAA